MKTRKIAILGGTGKSGKYLLKRLIENGCIVKVLTRHPDKIKDHDPSTEIVSGDARNYKSIFSLLFGCDVVISTLGQPAGEAPIFSQASKNVLVAMKQLNITRYIVTTGLSVNTPLDRKDSATQFATEWMYKNFPETTLDKQLEYEHLSQSVADWTMVRLPLIIQTDDKFPTGVSLDNCSGGAVSSTDLADFLISLISEDTYNRKCPFLFNLKNQ